MASIVPRSQCVYKIRPIWQARLLTFSVHMQSISRAFFAQFLEYFPGELIIRHPVGCIETTLHTGWCVFFLQFPSIGHPVSNQSKGVNPAVALTVTAGRRFQGNHKIVTSGLLTVRAPMPIFPGPQLVEDYGRHAVCAYLSGITTYALRLYRRHGGRRWI